MLRTFLTAAGLAFFALSAHAAHTQVQLLLADTSARPGDTVLAGVHLKMEQGWHTYWKNPGEAGMATKIVWTNLPPGVTAGDIQWPLPKKLPPEEVTTFGYEEEVVLLVPLKLAPDLKPGPLDLKAKVSWLECKEQCIPGSAPVQATLNIGSEDKPSPDAALLTTWQGKTPRSNSGLSLSAAWAGPAQDDTRPLVVSGHVSADTNFKFDSIDFYPDASDDFEIQPTNEVLSAFPADIRFRKSVKKFSGDWPKQISGLLILQVSGGARIGYDINLPVNGEVAGAAPSAGFSWTALLAGLGSAFLGGLILNIMPCVLPVIALKVFSFVKQGGEEPGRARRLSLLYALGILVSFLVLAGFLIALQKAGHVASWGSQMQNKNYVLGMTILVTLVALNLFGLFEVTLGAGAMNAAGSLSGKSGVSGAFFNGVLTTALAIPCTAPFLAAALTFAFGQPPAVILVVFCFIAFGLAAPYIVLTWNPKLLKWLPKPGAWMQHFKIALGFPMLATVVWLYKLSLNQLSKSQSLWFGIFLVTLALAAWIWGEFVQRGTSRRLLAAVISVAFVASVGAYAFTNHEQLTWQRWSAAAVQKAQSDGRPVLVDFTADWCVTCQVNLHTSIDTASVRQKLAEVHATTLLADYSVQDEEIGRELHRFGRDAVPLVVVFPKSPNAAPIVLPPVLTPGIVLAALDQAAK